MSNSEPPVSEHIQPPPIPWRVLRVKTGREFEVAELISEMGYETYCPKLISVSKVRRGRVCEASPRQFAMYPSWALSRCLPDARIDRLRRRGLVYPTPILGAVSEAQVQFVRVVELEAAMLSARKVKIKPGDFGTIMVGILKGEPIEVLQIRKQKLIVKLTRFDARSAPIQIAADDVAVTA